MPTPSRARLSQDAAASVAAASPARPNGLYNALSKARTRARAATLATPLPLGVHGAQHAPRIHRSELVCGKCPDPLACRNLVGAAPGPSIVCYAI